MIPIRYTQIWIASIGSCCKDKPWNIAISYSDMEWLNSIREIALYLGCLTINICVIHLDWLNSILFRYQMLWNLAFIIQIAWYIMAQCYLQKNIFIATSLSLNILFWMTHSQSHGSVVKEEYQTFLCWDIQSMLYF